MVVETGTLWVVNHYLRAHLVHCPEIMVLFGDNLQRTGLGGQAKECRGYVNAIGIPTKFTPGKDEAAYFSDYDIAVVTPPIDAAFQQGLDALLRGVDVAYPFYGVGSGRSMLEVKAPKVKALIGNWEKRLQKAASRCIRADNFYLVGVRKQMDRKL